MSSNRSGEVLVGTVIGGVIGLFVSVGGTPTAQFIGFGVGTLLGLVASLILTGIDYLRRPASAPPASRAIGEDHESKCTNGGNFEESLPAGESVALAEDLVAPVASPDPFQVSVCEVLEKIRNPKTSWIQALAILAISFVLFAGLDMQNNPIEFTAMIVGVLLFHELGHFVGMRFFGYRNVRMFFIPFFGAAVSGQANCGKSYQQAIVTLLGPVPGLCVGLALFGILRVPGLIPKYRIEFAQVATLLAMINGFNLLPVLPLDGGRLLNQILFARNRYLEGIFHVLAAIALIAYGATRGQQVLLWIGIVFLVTAGSTFKTNSIAQRVGSQFGGQLPPIDAPIPPAILQAIIAQIRSVLPGLKTAKPVANVTFRVWEKMHVQLPGAAMTLVLLLTYLSAATVAIGTSRSPSRLLEFKIEELARDANKDLPRWIDEVTRLDRIEPGPGKAFSYVYTVTRDMPEEQKPAMVENSTRRTLAAAEMQGIFSAGVTVWYKYYDTSGGLLLAFPVKKQLKSASNR
jgi:Zn-dependent protease